MGNSKNKNGYRLTEEGENISSRKEAHLGKVKLKKRVAEEVSDFINEGNPNTQFPPAGETDRSRTDEFIFVDEGERQ